MFRRTVTCLSAFIVLGLAACQDSGPFGLDKDIAEFERFGGNPLSLHDIHNGGFETGFFAPEWTTSVLPVGGFGFGVWKIADFDPFPLFGPATPHAEPLDADVVTPPELGASGQAFVAVATLEQSLTLPTLAAGETLWLAYQNRIKNFAGTPPFPLAGPSADLLWNAGAVATHDYRVEIEVGAVTTVLWSAAVGVGAPAPAFSGAGGSAAEAFYVSESWNISAFAGSSAVVRWVIEAGPPIIVDLDDIEIFVVPVAGDPIPFDDFSVEEARVESKKKGDELRVEGEFTLGGASDGIDPVTEEVTIALGDFSVTFEAGSFVRDDDDDDEDEDDSEGGWKLRRKKPGITKVKIDDDGEFEVRGKELDLGDPEFQDDITFTLTIGDDTGSFDILFDKKGKFEAEDDD